MNGFHNWSIFSSAYNNGDLPHTGYSVTGPVAIGFILLFVGLALAVISAKGASS